MISNRLAVNRDKTQLMVIKKPNKPKSTVIIQANPENIFPQPAIKFLGVTLLENLDFKPFLMDGNQNLYSQLKKRISVIKQMRKLIGFQFPKNLASATFMSKLLYAAEMWGPPHILSRNSNLYN